MLDVISQEMNHDQLVVRHDIKDFNALSQSDLSKLSADTTKENLLRSSLSSHYGKKRSSHASLRSLMITTKEYFVRWRFL